MKQCPKCDGEMKDMNGRDYAFRCTTCDHIQCHFDRQIDLRTGEVTKVEELHNKEMYK